jgi:tRNA (cmo5U34)-methyltransferase
MAFELVDLGPHDTGYAPSRWAFDAAVTRVFADMLWRSIPQLDTVRDLTVSLGVPYVRPGTAVLDLGCSLGDALMPFYLRRGAANRYVGVDDSPAMVDAAVGRFASGIEAGLVDIRRLDLRHDFPTTGPTSLILSILTLMFLPVERRLGVLRHCHDALVPGGALLLAEKLMGGPAFDYPLQVRYEAHKRAMGYTQEAIDRKRVSLQGVLVPLPARANEDLLEAAGFADHEVVWRWCNFAMWLAVKGA